MRSGDKHTPGRLVRLWCKWRGHKWQPLVTTQHSVCLVCLRCKENGWRL